MTHMCTSKDLGAAANAEPPAEHVLLRQLCHTARASVLGSWLPQQKSRLLIAGLPLFLQLSLHQLLPQTSRCQTCKQRHYRCIFCCIAWSLSPGCYEQQRMRPPVAWRTAAQRCTGYKARSEQFLMMRIPHLLHNPGGIGDVNSTPLALHRYAFRALVVTACSPFPRSSSACFRNN